MEGDIIEPSKVGNNILCEFQSLFRQLYIALF